MWQIRNCLMENAAAFGKKKRRDSSRLFRLFIHFKINI